MNTGPGLKKNRRNLLTGVSDDRFYYRSIGSADFCFHLLSFIKAEAAFIKFR